MPDGPVRITRLADMTEFEIATLEYTDWFNHRRLLETCGDVPPAELETAYYRQKPVPAKAGPSTP